MPSSDNNSSSRIIDILPEGLIILSPVMEKGDEIQDYQISYINSYGREALKFKDKVLAKRLSEYLSKSVWNKLSRRLSKVFHENETAVFKQKLQSKGGKKWLRFHAVKNARKLVLTFHDITSEIEQQKDLISSEKKYRKLFQESMDSIFLMNNEYLIMEANDSMVKYTGYDQKDLRFLSMQDLFKDPEEFWRFNKVLYKSNSVEEFEAELILSNGRTSTCVINVVEVPEKNQYTSIYQGVIKDITKRRKAEQELIMSEKLSMTGKIARSMAHEVRNPLTNLNLALEQLKDEFEETDEDADLYFNIIERNAKRIEELLSGLLESSKPKSLSFKKMNVNVIIENALIKVNDRMKLLGIELQKDLEKDLPKVGLDKGELEIALVNLMINAIEAMQVKGGRLSISSSFQDESVVIDIKDNGPGIPEEHLKSLFDPFFSVKKGGLGLGLTSVQNIIKSHNGQIEVSSEEGEGTNFQLRFHQ